MKLNIEKLNSFWIGLSIGVVIPILFSWIFLKRFYPVDLSFFEIISMIFPSVLLGKLFLLSIIPNLLGVFIFYKQDTFKIGIGIMIGAIPYLLVAVFMM